MGESEIPDVLLSNVYNHDTKRLISEIQLATFWLYVHPNESFDRQEALKLHGQFVAQRNARSKKAKQEHAHAKERARKELENLSRLIAEHCFQVEVLGDEREITTGIVKWDSNITDRKTGKLIGTPRHLLESIRFEWLFSHDPRKNLNGFLDDAKRRFDNFQYDFSIERNPLGEHALAEARPKKYSLTLRLTWKPFNESEIEKKFRKILRSHAQSVSLR